MGHGKRMANSVCLWLYWEVPWVSYRASGLWHRQLHLGWCMCYSLTHLLLGLPLCCSWSKLDTPSREKKEDGSCGWSGSSMAWPQGPGSLFFPELNFILYVANGLMPLSARVARGVTSRPGEQVMWPCGYVLGLRRREFQSHSCLYHWFHYPGLGDLLNPAVQKE